MSKITPTSMADYNRELNAISIRFTETASENDLFQEIARSFRTLTQGFAAFASRYNKQSNALTIAAMAIDAAVRAQMQALMGINFSSMEMVPPPHIQQFMISQVIARPKTLTELSFGAIPKDLATQIMQMLGVKGIVSVSLSQGAEILGSVASLHSGVDKAIPDEVLKTFAYMAGTAIARTRAEQALRESVQSLGLLSEIGRRIDQAPLIPEFLGWLASEIPHALRDPERGAVAIEFEGRVYGNPQAIDLPSQIVGGLRIGGELRGRIVAAYRTERDFVDDESALLGDVVRRVSVYIENRRLLEESQAHAMHEQMLREIAVQVRGSTDADEVARTAVRAVGSALGRPAFVQLDTGTETGIVGYRFDGIDLVPAKDLGNVNWGPRPGAITLSIDEAPALAVPLAVRGERPFGLLGVEQDPRTPLTAEERALIDDVAVQVVTTIESVRMFDRTQAALAEVESTHRSYLQREWQLYLRQRESLHDNAFVYDHTQVSTVPDLWLPEMERAVAERTLVVAGDGAEQSGLAVPITLRGQVIGVLGVQDPEGRFQASAEDRELMQAIGQQLGLALENARLLEDTRAQAAREQLLGEITTRIRAEIEIEALLERALEELGSALGAERAVIHLAGAGAVRSSERITPEVME